MKLANKFFIGVIFLSSIAVSVPASAAAVLFSGTFHAHRHNDLGTHNVPMRPRVNNFCFLSRVKIEETDRVNESANCRIIGQGSDWQLQAIIGRNGNAVAECSATCYTIH